MIKLVRGLLKFPEILHRLKVSKLLNVSYLVHVKKNTVIVGQQYIHVGKNFCADIDVKIEAWDHHKDENYSPEIIIGDNVFINSRTHITAINKLVIGDGVLIGSDVLICDNNHGGARSIEELEIPPQQRPLYSKGPITIEQNVWIGDKAIILDGVTVGKNSIIAAGSIVTKNVPAYSVVAGNPSKVVKQLVERE